MTAPQHKSSMPCSPQRRASAHDDMRQMAKIVHASASNYLSQSELFRDGDNLDAQVLGVLTALKDNAEDLYALLGKRKAAA